MLVIVLELNGYCILVSAVFLVALQYIKAMIKLFGQCTMRGIERLRTAADIDDAVEMEEMFSRMGLDVIGKAVFNYDFDALTRDTPLCEAVYCVLREAEDRSVAPVQYWKIPLASTLIPRQQKVQYALRIINETLDNLIAECQRLVELGNRLVSSVPPDKKK